MSRVLILLEALRFNGVWECWRKMHFNHLSALSKASNYRIKLMYMSKLHNERAVARNYSPDKSLFPFVSYRKVVNRFSKENILCIDIAFYLRMVRRLLNTVSDALLFSCGIKPTLMRSNQIGIRDLCCGVVMKFKPAQDSEINVTVKAKKHSSYSYFDVWLDLTDGNKVIKHSDDLFEKVSEWSSQLRVWNAFVF